MYLLINMKKKNISTKQMSGEIVHENYNPDAYKYQPQDR